MRAFRDISIKRKLVIITMFVSCVALVLACTSFFVYDLISFRNEIVEGLSILADIIGSNSTAALMFNDPDSAADIMAALTAKRSVVYACIYDAQGEIFTQHRLKDVNKDFDLPKDLYLSHRFVNGGLDVVKPIILDGETLGRVYLHSDLEELRSRFRSYVIIMALILAASMLIAFILSSKLQKVISTPILDLAKTARIISTGKDYSIRAMQQRGRQDEIGSLFEGFNEMLGQIEKRDASLQEARAILEQRVNERTEELQTTVKELERSRQAALSVMEDASAARDDAEREKDRIEAMLKSIGDGVLVVDLKQKIVLINNAAERITGWTNEEAFGRDAEDVFNIISEETREKVESPLITVFAKNSIVQLTSPTVLIRKGGGEVPISDSGAPIMDKEGRIMGAILVFRDVSDKKKGEKEKEDLQSQLFQSQKMESIGLLAGGIAHDFNNLLQGILGYTSMIKERIDSDDENYPHLSLIEVAAERAADLTQQLLSFARKGKYNIVSIDAKTIVDNVIGLTQRTFDKNIEIIKTFDTDLLSIPGDRGQVHQALMNVCINAREAMPKGGILSVSVQNLLIDETNRDEYRKAAPGKYVVFTIRDNGVGMDQETLSRIFEPFFTTRLPGKGTGLGLAMVFGVAQNHGGFVDVSSEVGKGSTFRLFFPAEEAPQKKETVKVEHEINKTDYSPKKIQADSKERTILIIDDEEIVSYLARDMLQMMGHRTLNASNGREGLEIYRENWKEIDVVILDMIMPKMGGLEAFRELKKINPDVKVVVSSGYEEDERFQEIMREGAFSYLKKPFVIQKLADAVREALGEEILEGEILSSRIKT